MTDIRVKDLNESSVPGADYYLLTDSATDGPKKVKTSNIVKPSDIGAATAAQGAKADSAVQPGALATVATSGQYSDLSDKPTLGAMAAKNNVAISDISATGTPSSTTALFGDGQWKTPAGAGDMVAATYDPAAMNANAFDGYPIADRTTLAGLSTSDFTTAYLRESGREGTFLWNGANLSTQVTADTGQGDYVAPTSAPTGASGAWQRVRKFGDLFKTSEYGDDIAKAMAACSARGGGTVEVNTVGTLLVSKGLIKPADVSFVGLGEGKSIIKPNWTTLADFATLGGDAQGKWVLACQDGNSSSMSVLPAFSAVGADETAILFSSAHGLLPGDEICLYDAADYSFSPYQTLYRRGERHTVQFVDGLRVYLDYGLLGDWTYGTYAKAYKVSTWKGKFGGFTVDATGLDPSLGSWGLVKVWRAANAEIDDISAYAADSSGIEFDQCHNLRATRMRSWSMMDGTADTHHYPLAISASTNVIVQDSVGVGVWAGSDFYGWDTFGAMQSYRSGYDHCTLTNDGATLAAGVHGCSQECFYRDSLLNGGSCMGGKGFTLERSQIRVRRGINSAIIYGSDVVSGNFNIIDCDLYSQKNGGGDTSPTGAVYFRAEAGANGRVFLNIRGGSIKASAETRPVEIYCMSTSAPISYCIEDIDVDFTSVDTNGMVRVTNTVTPSSTPDYAVQRNIRGYIPSRPWATWAGSYTATYMEMPRQKGIWSGTSTAVSSMDSVITLPHAYPTGYVVGGSATLLTNNLYPYANGSIRSLSRTDIRPMVATGDGTNLNSGQAFDVSWETW